MVEDKDKSIAQAARDADVDWRTMKSWILGINREWIKGLVNKPCGRARPVSDEIKKLIVDLKVEKRSRSARKIRDLLTDN